MSRETDLVAIVSPPHNLASSRSTYANMVDYCQENRIEYVESGDVNSDETFKKLLVLQPDMFFQTGWHSKISKRLLEHAAYGFWSIHPSVLPVGRGGAVLNWALVNGEKEWGVTLLRLDEGLDSGDILGRALFEIDKNDYIKDVYVKADKAAFGLLSSKMKVWLASDKLLEKQDEKLVTVFPRRTKKDGKIDWMASAESICRLVKAVSEPFHGAYSYLLNGIEVTVWRAYELNDDEDLESEIGAIRFSDQENILVVKAGKGLVCLESFSVGAVDKSPVSVLNNERFKC